MKALASAFVLVASLLLTASAQAGPFERHSGSPFATLGGGVTVPPEWAGIWTTTDTVYNCPSTYQGSSTSTDTLCAGQVFENDSTFVCTGSSTATTFDQVCDGSDIVFADCVATIHLVTHGTRTADSYSSVTTITSTYSGSDPSCALFPPGCTQINTHATRIAPAPAAYCSTPAKPATWGQLKAQYR
jgi:hypothetical protein